MTGGSPQEGLEAQLEAEVKIGGRGQNRGHGGHGGHGGRGHCLEAPRRSPAPNWG